MWWLIVLVGVLSVYVGTLHLRVKALDALVKRLHESHAADHELLLQVTEMTTKLDAIDVLERVGDHKQADAVRGYEQPDADLT